MKLLRCVKKPTPTQAIAAFPQELVLLGRATILIKGIAKRLGIKWSPWLLSRPRSGWGPGQACRPNFGGLVLGCIDADVCE